MRSSVPAWEAGTRIGGLRRFAAAITVLTLVGHVFLGFEPSWAQPVVALASTYSTEILLEWSEARAQRRRPAFAGRGWLDFLLPAHISGLTIAMLLYPGQRLMPVVFASVVAIGSKAILRFDIAGRKRHVFNPSNLGITATLLAFPSVGIAPPYQFTENLLGMGDWVLPGIVVMSGSFLNARFTRRWPLIGAWLVGFVLQAFLRHWLLGSSLPAALMPMTGMAFLLFTFYMVTDPPTTPASVRAQVLFGSGVACLYGMLMATHIVFGLFFSLSIACGIRFLVLALTKHVAQPVHDIPIPRPTPGPVREVTSPEKSHARV